VEAATDGNATRVLPRARTLPYVEDVTIFGNSLHLLVPVTVDDETIRRDLSAEIGGEEIQIRAIAPSLEDVFVRLTYLRSEEAAGRAREGGKQA
jgi:hypothetical protein